MHGMELIRRLFWATVIAVLLLAGLSFYGYLEPTEKGRQGLSTAQDGLVVSAKTGVRWLLRAVFEKNPEPSAEVGEVKRP